MPLDRDGLSPEAAAVAGVVERFNAAWDRRDIDALMALVADDAVYDASVGPGPGREYRGRAAVRDGFLAMLAHDLPGDTAPVLVMCDARRALVLWTVREPTAVAPGAVVRGCDIFLVQDGLIRHKDAYRKTNG